MRFTEFKPFLYEFAGVEPTVSLDQIKVDLDSIAEVAKALPAEANLDIRKIAFDFTQAKAKVDEYLNQLISTGKVVDDSEESEAEDDDGNQVDSPTAEPVEQEPQAVEPTAEPQAQEPVPTEVPATEPEAEEPVAEIPPEEEEELEQVGESITESVSGDTEYNEAVKAVEESKAEIEYIESLKIPDAAKKRMIGIYQKTIDSATKLLKKYAQTVDALKTEREKRQAAEDFADDVFDILEHLANKVQGYVAISDEEYKGLNKTQKKIHDNARTFASTFKTAFFGMVLNMLRQNEEIDREAISTFLNACYNGDVINMLGLVNAGQGNVRDHVNSEYQDILNLFAQYGVFSWTPGKTGGAVGPGEMALSMMGNPAEKAKSGGDLLVGGHKLEIKAGTSSGGRLNSKKILKGPAAWPVWTKGIENIINSKNKSIPKDATWAIKDKKGNVITVNKTKFSANSYNITNGKAKLGAKYNFNYRNLNALNDEVLIYSDTDKTYDLFYNTFATLITNLDEVARPGTNEKGEVILGPDNKPLFPGVKAEKLIWGAMFDDGTIDVNKMMAAYTRLAYESYNRADHVESIMFLNTDTLDFSIASGSQDLLRRMGGGADSTVRITGGFNFNDDQQSATPAYLATARSEKIAKKK